MIRWVDKQRRGRLHRCDPPTRWTHATDDDLRRIELCARAALDVAMFNDLYGPLRTGRIDHIGGDPHAPAPQVRDQC